MIRAGVHGKEHVKRGVQVPYSAPTAKASPFRAGGLAFGGLFMARGGDGQVANIPLEPTSVDSPYPEGGIVQNPRSLLPNKFEKQRRGFYHRNRLKYIARTENRISQPPQPSFLCLLRVPLLP
jgi:hypothetical protein